MRCCLVVCAALGVVVLCAGTWMVTTVPRRCDPPQESSWATVPVVATLDSARADIAAARMSVAAARVALRAATGGGLRAEP